MTALRWVSKLRVSKDKADALLDSARHDASFLARHGVMDYSLLVGIFQPNDAPRDILCAPQLKWADSTSITRANDSPRPSLNDVQSGEQLSEFNSRHFSRLPSSLTAPMETNVKILDALLPHAPTPKTPAKANGDETRPPAAFDVAIEGTSDSGERELYYLGIIDILQKYTIRKHLETDLNILTKGLKHYRDCSCVSPHEYRDRFLEFLTRIF